MAQESPAKFKVKGIHQVAVVVKDIQAAAENYWNILGIGPWDIYEWEAPAVYDRTYYGKPAWAREKIAITQVGAVQMELVQPIEGDSIYQDSLTEHGEGLHHINFLGDNVAELDKAGEILAKEGFPTQQSGRIGIGEDKGGYSYIDIKPLHTIWEPVHEAGNLTAVATRYPATGQVSPAKIKVKGINQIALVVNDLQRTVENYWSILGIGPWDISMLEAPVIFNRTYYGRRLRGEPRGGVGCSPVGRRLSRLDAGESLRVGCGQRRVRRPSGHGPVSIQSRGSPVRVRACG